MNILRKFILMLATALASVASAQEYDLLVQNYLAEGDWIAAKDVLDTHGNELSPLALLCTKAFTGYIFNNNEQTIEAVYDIMNNHQDELDASSIFNFVYLGALSYDAMGMHKECAEYLGPFLESVRPIAGIPKEVYAGHERFYNLSCALAQYPRMTVERHGKGVVPFARDTVGPKRNVSLRIEAKVNGQSCSPVFDTGAAQCVMTPEAAERYGLKITDGTLIADAAKSEEVRYAVADELVMGDITYHNVLFALMDFKAGHAEAEQYLNFDVLIGLNVMSAMGEMVMDFEHDMIAMSEHPTAAGPANLMRSINSLTYSVRTYHDGEPIDFLVDTGNSDYMFLDGEYYAKHKDWLATNAEIVPYRLAGLNGVILNDKYKIRDFKITADGNEFAVPEVLVPTSDQNVYLERNNMGLPAMALCKRVIINFRDAYMKFEK
ncbi:MAG: retroviral-like aspartic protease family protein [Muribaculaceae bacterium]|nr:retroviral-like aspartic protease family protein [Muribaculaceae bacterium]